MAGVYGRLMMKCCSVAADVGRAQPVNKRARQEASPPKASSPAPASTDLGSAASTDSLQFTTTQPFQGSALSVTASLAQDSGISSSSRLAAGGTGAGLEFSVGSGDLSDSHRQARPMSAGAKRHLRQAARGSGLTQPVRQERPGSASAAVGSPEPAAALAGQSGEAQWGGALREANHGTPSAGSSRAASPAKTASKASMPSTAVPDTSQVRTTGTTPQSCSCIGSARNGFAVSQMFSRGLCLVMPASFATWLPELLTSPYALLGTSKHLKALALPNADCPSGFLMLQENCVEPVLMRDNDSQTGSARPSTMAPARRPPGRSIGMSTVVRLLLLRCLDAETLCLCWPCPLDGSRSAGGCGDTSMQPSRHTCSWTKHDHQQLVSALCLPCCCDDVGHPQCRAHARLSSQPRGIMSDQQRRGRDIFARIEAALQGMAGGKSTTGTSTEQLVKAPWEMSLAERVNMRLPPLQHQPESLRPQPRQMQPASVLAQASSAEDRLAGWRHNQGWHNEPARRSGSPSDSDDSSELQELHKQSKPESAKAWRSVGRPADPSVGHGADSLLDASPINQEDPLFRRQGAMPCASRQAPPGSRCEGPPPGSPEPDLEGRDSLDTFAEQRRLQQRARPHFSRSSTGTASAADAAAAALRGSRLPHSELGRRDGQQAGFLHSRSDRLSQASQVGTRHPRRGDSSTTFPVSCWAGRLCSCQCQQGSHCEKPASVGVVQFLCLYEHQSHIVDMLKAPAASSCAPDRANQIICWS